MLSNVTPIEDSLKSTDTNENYIKDLEAEIDTLNSRVALLTKELKDKPTDTNCCKAYEVIKTNFHRLINDILPF